MAQVKLLTLFLVTLVILLTGCEVRPESGSGVRGSANFSANHLKLIAAVGQSRFLRLRLSGFTYSPCGKTPWSPPLRCVAEPNVEPELDQRVLRSAARSIEREAASKPESGSLWARGVLRLSLAGKGEALQGAIEDLEAAHDLAPTNPWLTNDLASGYAFRAVERHRPIDLVQALEQVETALVMEPRLSEGWFNKALISERLHLLKEAIEAWKTVEILEPESGWKSEAVARIADLQSRLRAESSQRQRSDLDFQHLLTSPALALSLARKEPQRVRQYAEEEILGQWGLAMTSGKPEAADRLLELARVMGPTLAKLTGDSMVAAAVDSIDQARRESVRSPRRLSQLAEEHASFHQAFRLYETYKARDAAPLFRRAAKQLGRAGSAFSGWATLYLAICHYYQPDYATAIELLDRLALEKPRDRYPILAGRGFWIRGLTYLVQGRLDESVDAYEQALAIFERAGEKAYVAYVHSLIAKNLRLSGAREEAWQHRLMALAGRELLSTPDRIFSILLEAAEACQEEGLGRASLSFFDAQLEAAQRLGRPFVTAEAYLRRSRAYYATGDSVTASADLEAARALLLSVADVDQGLADAARADLAALEGELALSGNPGKAIGLLTGALNHFFESGSRIDAIPLYRRRAEARLAIGDARGAEDDLAAGIAEVERQRSDLESPDRRAAYLFQARALFDSMIQLQVESLGQPEQAFVVAEQGRNRTLLDLAFPKESTGRRGATFAVNQEAVEAQLPDETVLLVYAPLPEALALWVVSKAGTQFSMVPVSRRVLEDRVHRLRQEVQRGDGRRLAENLSLLLLPKEVAQLPRGASLVVVPGGFLHDLPFAALTIPGGGERLIARHQLTVAPSITLYLSSLERQRLLDRDAPLRALVVSDPAFDPMGFPRLKRLSAANSEADAVAALYPLAEQLNEREATRSRILAELAEADLFHFAGHALTAGIGDFRSGLVLAPEGVRGDALLQPNDIACQRPLRLRVAILAACRTAVGYHPGSEEISHLAGAFLAAGVPAVVASLWEVEDTAAATLMVAFHRRLASGIRPAEALRQAQLELASSPDPKLASPATWAAFRLLGAD